ncbi:uncharacterized protein LOC127245688 [Andrographis paniculata]|uniref:uncharacterized protein LOC127245688 n=1 Tax=Andrographis paniculata TaxID=175694 RepID=UPI0021E8F3F9|nr:uncharacterized protein LOC127245688 [Andrographis paniculata]
MLSAHFFLSEIYAKCSITQRRELWEVIKTIAHDLTATPWLLGGDFNAISDISERDGPGRTKIRSARDFSDAILEANLLDAGFIGSPFTWTNNKIWERLDRVPYNNTWMDLCTTTTVFYLPRNVSGHSPLLISVKLNAQRSQSAFQFQHMWIKHHNFMESVENSWNAPSGCFGQLNLHVKLKRLKFHLKDWNKSVFGNIFAILANADSKAAESELVYDINPSQANLIEKNRCFAELTKAISMEEAFWK